MTSAFRPATAWLAAVCSLAILGLAACTSGGDAGTTSADGVGVAEEAPVGAAVAGADEADRDSAGTSARPAAQTRAIIYKGSVTIRAEDVAAARDEVVAIATRSGGEIADERSESDDRGEMRASSLVLRIPSPDFVGTLSELTKVAQNVVSSTNSEDVTTQVIDTAVRIRAQERSIRRIEVLLDRARSIRDIVKVEGELTRRQAALESLQSQQSYLSDMTSLGTIQVRIERGDEDPVPVAEQRGFVTGLGAGWSGLKSFTVGLLTLLGTVLPFALVLATLALPTWLLASRLTRRPLTVRPAEAPDRRPPPHTSASSSPEKPARGTPGPLLRGAAARGGVTPVTGLDHGHAQRPARGNPR